MIRLLVILTIFVTSSVSSSCFFPEQIQGNYITEGSSVSISIVEVTPWGTCQEYRNDFYILSVTKVVIVCYKCYQFNVVTENVILVYTEKGDMVQNPRCYPTIDQARQNCPTPKDIRNIRDNELYYETVLYKIFTSEDTPKNHVPCPINGRYNLTYTPNNSTELKCVKSELDTCPSNTNMNLRFNQCNENYEHIQYECLDTWQDDDNTKYLALLEVDNNTTDSYKFHCAIYEDLDTSGAIKIIVGDGSSCTWARNRNYKSTNITDLTGMPKETIVLYPAEEPLFKSLSLTCSFPDYLHGKWIHLEISSKFILFRDPVTRKTYKMGCIKRYNKPNRYLLYARDQCFQTQFKCIWMEQRTENIIEFRLSKRTSEHYDITLCEDNNFNENWSTIVRLDNSPFKSPCPISGNFIGILPDERTLCANLSSECISKGIMHYSVFTCDYNKHYDIRKYLCLGQWQHEDLVYTFTKRLDMGRYECFVGTNMVNNSMHIAELGESCYKGINPNIIGMKMLKITECPAIEEITNNLNDTEVDGYNEMNNSIATTIPIWIPNTDVPLTDNSTSAKLFMGHKLFCLNIILLSIFFQ